MTQRIGIAIFVLALTAGGVAQANEWTRTGPNGSVTRSYDPATGLSVTRSGVNGGGSTATVTCARGQGLVCQRDFTRTGPEGQSVSGTRTTQRGLFRKRSVTTVTRPDGSTRTRVRAAPRYNKPWVRR